MHISIVILLRLFGDDDKVGDLCNFIIQKFTIKDIFSLE